MSSSPPRRRLADLNEASEEALRQLPGVGAKLAERILERRAEAPIPSLSALADVKGIGAATLEKIGRYAYVDPELGLRGEPGVEDHDADLRQRCSKILVGAWNVRNLGRKSLDTDRARDVAAIVAEYDVVALLELRDDEVVDGLLDILGRERWAATMSAEVGTDHHKEVYAYFYRTASVELLRAELIGDSADEWVREPFMAHFCTPGGFDFIMAAVHVIWGKTVAARRDEVVALGERLEEIEQWTGEKDIMLLGDFNLEPEDKAWDSTRAAGWIPLLEGPALKSMVGDTHLYDNIWIHRTHTASSEWLGASGVIRFDQVLDFGGGEESKKQATKELSDHRPTWALFATDVDDDEASAAGLPLFD